ERHGPQKSGCATAPGQPALGPNIERDRVIERRLGRTMPFVIGFLDPARRVRNVAAAPLLPVGCALFFLHDLQFSDQNRCYRSDMKIPSLYFVGVQVEGILVDLKIQRVDWISHGAYGSELIARRLDSNAFSDQLR